MVDRRPSARSEHLTGKTRQETAFPLTIRAGCHKALSPGRASRRAGGTIPPPLKPHGEREPETGTRSIPGVRPTRLDAARASLPGAARGRRETQKAATRFNANAEIAPLGRRARGPTHAASNTPEAPPEVDLFHGSMQYHNLPSPSLSSRPMASPSGCWSITSTNRTPRRSGPAWKPPARSTPRSR